MFSLRRFLKVKLVKVIIKIHANNLFPYFVIEFCLYWLLLPIILTLELTSEYRFSWKSKQWQKFTV